MKNFLGLLLFTIPGICNPTCSYAEVTTVTEMLRKTSAKLWNTSDSIKVTSYTIRVTASESAPEGLSENPSFPDSMGNADVRHYKVTNLAHVCYTTPTLFLSKHLVEAIGYKDDGSTQNLEKMYSRNSQVWRDPEGVVYENVSTGYYFNDFTDTQIRTDKQLLNEYDEFLINPVKLALSPALKSALGRPSFYTNVTTSLTTNGFLVVQFQHLEDSTTSPLLQEWTIDPMGPHLLKSRVVNGATSVPQQIVFQEEEFSWANAGGIDYVCSGTLSLPTQVKTGNNDPFLSWTLVGSPTFITYPDFRYLENVSDLRNQDK